MKHWVVGDFFDGTCRLIGSPNGFEHPKEAEARLEDIEGQQTKPHHVDYRVVQANDLTELIDQGVLTMGYP